MRLTRFQVVSAVQLTVISSSYNFNKTDKTDFLGKEFRIDKKKNKYIELLGGKIGHICLGAMSYQVLRVLRYQ